MQRIAMANFRTTWVYATLLALFWAFALPLTGAHGQFRDVTPGKEPAPVDVVELESPATLPTTVDDVEIAQPAAVDEFVSESIDEELAPVPEPMTDDSVQDPVEPETASLPEPSHDTEYEIIGEEEVERVELVDDKTIRSLKFRGVLVGESTEAELLDLWGQPFKTYADAAGKTLKYRIAPFRQVDVTFVGDSMSSILIHLEDALEPRHCASELRITKITPVPVPDEEGRVIGMVFPERGVMLSFDARYSEHLVSKIQLEPISPEPFLLRAEYDYRYDYSNNMRDIDQALAMNSRFGRAHWVKSERLLEIGRFHDALDAVNKALHYSPESTRYRLTKAKIMAINGDYDVALREAKLILDMDGVHPVIKADAELLVGNIYSTKAPGRFKQAMNHHLAAIELGSQMVNDARFEVRRKAKEILVDTHLAVARDISLGEYDRQDQVVPKWLSRASAIVDEYVSRDDGDPSLRLKVYRQMLATAADLRAEGDPGSLIRKMSELGRKLVSDATDPQNQGRLEWMLGTGLAEAVRLQRLRGEQADAMQLADDALVLFQQSAKRRQSTPEQRHIVGRLYFHVGSLHAVHRKDHDEAVSWYRKAEPLLDDETPPALLADAGTYGEMFVSMGVSYWQTGQRNTAIDLTEMGTDILQRAVVDGVLDPTALAIPYSNLATMHQKTGNETDAQAFAELASSIKSDEPLQIR